MSAPRIKDKGSLWYRFARLVLKNLFYRLLGGYRAIHAERFPLEGPVLVAPVHVSLLDPPVVGCDCPRQINFMAKKELFKNPLFGRLLRSVGAFPVARGEGDTAAIRGAIEILQQGRCVLIFPEGTRGDGESFGEIKPGIAMLAKRSGAVVMPVGIHGTQLRLGKGSRRLRLAKITVVFGRPLKYSEIEAEGDPKTARDRFTQAYIAALDEACREAGLVMRPFGSPDGQEPATKAALKDG